MENSTHFITVITHPQKIIFPGEKITKQAIADYYGQISPLILPYISDRPLSLLRCPKGVSQKCFFQKHPFLGEIPLSLNSFKVQGKSDIGVYISLHSKEGLRQLVQMNAFEIHTWNCYYQNLMRPNQIIMDFDPAPDVSFKAVVNLCLEMKKILDKLKLLSFVKVSGGSGIHIHIPIEPLYTWDQVLNFSRSLADELAAIYPEFCLSSMSKKLRVGKVFIDYLRNSYGATTVAPYAIRARLKSSVALPVKWSELKVLKSSDQFTIKKALLKIKTRKSDPWEKLLSVKQKITILD
jgi:bifunctional non-homologous end joining protein LigD